MSNRRMIPEVASGPPRDIRSQGRGCHGSSLLEVLLVLALTLVVSGGLLGATRDLRAERAGREAARLLLHDLQQVARDARLRGQTLGVELVPLSLGPARFTVYADGNGNGIRVADVIAGIDAALGPARLAFREGQARLAVVTDVPSADGHGMIAEGAAPVRFGIAPYVSFSPRGTGPSGSIYVAGPAGAQYAIRVLGTTGRLRLSCFDKARHVWMGC